MQQQMRTNEKLLVAEKERDLEVEELKEMKTMADEANEKLTSELDFVRENLNKTTMDFKDTERELEVQLADKNSCLDKLRTEISDLKRSESRAKAALSENKLRIEELEREHRNCKESEEKLRELLQESKLEMETLLENSSSDSQKDDNGLINSLKSELESTKQNVGVLKNELKLATEAEENNKKAMDDLALALTEVATESNQIKAKYMTTEAELKQAKEEVENLKKMEEKNKTQLNEARREADIYKSTVERLRLEADESLQAWSGRETSLVNCIRRAEEDRYNTQQENRRLNDTLRLAELGIKTSKEEIKKLRDILKQALNEASVAKEAAGIATEENSQLKDCLAEKENALNFIGSENESLKVSQAAAMENIKDLKVLLEEASKKETNKLTEEMNKDHEEKVKTQNLVEKVKTQNSVEKVKTQNSVEKEDIITIGRRLGKAFSFSFMELRNNSVKKKEVEEEEEPGMDETLKGSIFDDEVESPGTPRKHHKKSSSHIGDMVINEEDFDEYLEESHFDDMDRNSRKKKALMRRFGDILLLRKRSFPKKEQSPE